MSKSPSYPPTASASLGPNPYAADTFPATGSSSRNMLSSKETDPSADEDAEAASETNQKVKKHWKDRGWDTALGPLTARRFLKKAYIKWYILLLIICALVGLMTIYHDEIITWIKPFAEKLKDNQWAWIVPVGILFVLSFPPLFGHEIIGVLCGLIWGLWVGFGIVSLGTILGEWGNYAAFRWFCSGRAKKYEEKDVTYACMVRVIQEGGFWVILVARFSAIPGHLTTPVFSTCGVNFWVFSVTAILTLPKQLQVVYLGTIFDQPEEEKSSTSQWVQNGVLAFSFLITIGAAWWLYRKMAKWRPIVERERREAQEAKEARNSLLTAPTTVTDSGSMYGRSSEHLTQNAEAPAGYGRADDWVDPYVRHPYSNDQFSSSSVALTATPHPKSMRTGPLLEPSIYVQPPPAASSDELQPREELDAYARRQDHAYNAVISVPPQSRRPSAQPVPHPLQAPQHTYNPYDQSSQHHPSPLMQQHGSPYLQQDQPRTYPYQDSWSAPRSSADFYSEDNHGPRDSRYFGQAM